MLLQCVQKLIAKRENSACSSARSPVAAPPSKLVVLVVERQLHGVPRVPVHADAVGGVLADRGQRIGERVRAAHERVVVDVELVVSRDQFAGAPARLARLERAARREAAEGFFLAGDEPRELRLPGGVRQRVGQRGAAHGARHVLLDLRVLAEQAEAAAVVVELRREAQALAVGERRVVRRDAGRGVGAIAEHALLARRAIGRQRRCWRRCRPRPTQVVPTPKPRPRRLKLSELMNGWKNTRAA